MTHQFQYLTLSRVEGITGINKITLRKMCQKGQIPGAFRLDGGSVWLIPPEWAEARRVDDVDLTDFVPVGEAAEMAVRSGSAVRTAAERGTITGIRREVNERGHWWINIRDDKFIRYSQKVRVCMATLDSPELYAFHDYIVDRKLLAKGEPTLEDSRVLWDIHGEEYLGYCEDSGYEAEDLGVI